MLYAHILITQKMLRMKKNFGGEIRYGIGTGRCKMVDIDTGAKTTDLNTIKDVGGTNQPKVIIQG